MGAFNLEPHTSGQIFFYSFIPHSYLYFLNSVLFELLITGFYFIHCDIPRIYMVHNA